MSIAKNLILAASLFGTALLSHAGVIDTFTPATKVTVTKTKFFEFEYTVPTKNFDYLTQSLEDVKLTIFLTDENKGDETLKFIIGGTEFAQVYRDDRNNAVNNGKDNITPVDIDLTTALGQLNTYGKLSVFLSTDSAGDYNFTGSSLSATVVDKPQRERAVPEPATLGLMGLGLAALAVRRRRQS
ncbi:PEP-CTERM sorting domain-containing protein [Massilia consociata]|uniref:PEP-CTERM sorting domain-containing protein n=1 Tax=Massilia consociata TaxID=760117 RepID=A0ABV6FHX1_9BURK